MKMIDDGILIASMDVESIYAQGLKKRTASPSFFEAEDLGEAPRLLQTPEELQIAGEYQVERKTGFTRH